MPVHSLEKSLKEHPFIQGFDPQYVQLFLGCAQNCRFRAGEYLWRQGERANICYLIRSGKVGLQIDIPHQGPLQVETVGSGEVLGWSWCVAPFRWHFDARAISAVRAFSLDAACLRAKYEEDHEFGYQMLTRITQVIEERLRATRNKVIDLYEAGA